MTCSFSKRNFGEQFGQHLAALYSENLSDNEMRSRIIDIIVDLSSLMNTKNNIESALEVINDNLMWVDEEQHPSINDIRLALSGHGNITRVNQDNSTSNITKNIEERYNDDPFDTAYESALNAKIRAQQLFNTIGVRSVLFNENGIVRNTAELNTNIQEQLELLLLKVLDYIRSRILPLDRPLELLGPDVRMYKDGLYTGIVEKLQREYGKFFGKENFSVDRLNKYYNDKSPSSNSHSILDAYGAWVMLTNFDSLLQKLFGKAITINPDSPKYTAQLNKYSIAGGSNVYATWRNSEEIDLSKEINNISQAIITSLPFIRHTSTTPEERNLKFNEFIYAVCKIKDIVLEADGDYTFTSDEGLLDYQLPEEIESYVNGKSFKSILLNIRTNPQEVLPVIFELLLNESIRSKLVSENALPANYFLDIDLDIINSVYKGLFDRGNPSSLISIQEKSGMKGVNYYAFIAQTVDSTFSSKFLQYYRSPDGKIFVRRMYNEGIDKIKKTLEAAINNINSQLYITNYDEFRKLYNITETLLPFDNGTAFATYDGKNYSIKVVDKEVVSVTDILSGTEVTDIQLRDNIKRSRLIELGKISSVLFLIPNFRGNLPLDVSVDLKSGLISYRIGSLKITGFTDEDYETLSPLILEVLKLNFDIDVDYFNALKNRNGGLAGNVADMLMELVSRVIANQYIQNVAIKNAAAPKTLIKTIYGDNAPIFNRRTGEMNSISSREDRIIQQLAEAKAQATGRLTSSQILDGEGNALASSSLSRLLSTLLYQVQQQVKQNGSAALKFSIWDAFKGIHQLKEFKDMPGDFSKSHTAFSATEMETATLFVDFIQGLSSRSSNSLDSVLGDGVIAVIPSENSDKTYMARMLLDLKKIKVTETESLYDLLKEGNLSRIEEFQPIIIKELGDFYRTALDNINQEWAKVTALVSDFAVRNNIALPEGTILLIEYGNWSYLETVAAEAKMTPKDLVNQVVTEYNSLNTDDPIVLLDEVHYVTDGNTFKVNQTFIGNLLRFNPENLDLYYDFVRTQEIELLQTLLSDKLEVLADDKIKKWCGEEWIDSKTNKVILGRIVDINTGEVILEIRKSRDLTLEDLDVLNNPNNTKVLQLNPVIKAYNLINYFATLEFMASTVGAFYGHPSKSKLQDGSILSILMDEKSRKNAQDKRNVSFTAAMHSFLKNLIEGIPEEINIAVMSDVKDYFTTIDGLDFDMKPFDGATFENPFFGILQNNSLGGARVGQNKKTFTHYYNQKTGTGGIIKTAEFPLTNRYIRWSKFYQTMMKNMTDRKWKDKDGNLFYLPVDINTGAILDYDENPITWTNPHSYEGNIYFKEIDEDGSVHYYQITKIEGLGLNKFRRYKVEVDENGVVQVDENGAAKEKIELMKEEVDSNYLLWKLFGGENFMELVDGKLEFSEYNMNIVANFINSVGTKNEGVTTVRYQSDLYQPLKHSDIHLMPTIGAVKQGAGNINPLSAYDIADPNKINFMRVKLNLAGVQLDKEHNADGEDLSIMTQVISACAARGYTHEQTQELLTALASLARNGFKENLKAFSEFFLNPQGVKTDAQGRPLVNENGEVVSNADAYQQVILDVLMKAFTTSTNLSQMVTMIARELLDKAKLGKEISFREMNSIPYSDPAVFRRLSSIISVALTRASIRIKVDGLLAVLSPSYNIVKLYNGKTLDSFNSDAEIQAEQALLDNNDMYELYSPVKGIDNLGNIKLGRTYRITRIDGSVEYRLLRTSRDYYTLKKQISMNPQLFVSIRELFAPVEGQFEGGRELASYNATFRNENSTDTKTYNIYDLASITELSRLQYLLELAKKADPNKRVNILVTGSPATTAQTAREIGGVDVLRHPDANGMHFGNPFTYLPGEVEAGRASVLTNNVREAVVAFEQWLNGTAYLDVEPERRQWILNQINSGNLDGKTLVYYTDSVVDTDGIRKKYDPNIFPNHAHILQKFVNRKNNLHLSASTLREQIKSKMDEVLADLMKLHKKSGSVNILNSQNQVQTISIAPDSVQIDAYEVIMPKIFASIFGLRKGDNINDIKDNREFFLERLLERRHPEIPGDFYDIGLMRMNGNNIYLLNADEAIEREGIFERKTISTVREKKKIYRMYNGLKLYEMKEGDEVWEYKATPNSRPIEVIVTRNMKHYIDSLKYTMVNISESKLSNEFAANILNTLSASKNKAAKRYSRSVLDLQLSDLSQAIREIQNGEPSEGLINLAHEIHTSFLESLKVVAARIPAQSMQSFMPMKVVAFEGEDVNTAFVSTAQILFQGSDYDIDAVSLASFAFGRDGRYAIHSPYANLETSELLEASKKLPFPTGESLLPLPDNDVNLDLYFSEGYTTDETVPIRLMANGVLVYNYNPEAIRRLGEFIRLCNEKGYIPIPPGTSNEVISSLVQVVNTHNDYINDENAEDFIKNFVVNSMYEIGISPANLIESLQAMDGITAPLKDVANSTKKAQTQTYDNPFNFTTNIHGITQNMSGKQGVGICAVGLKSFFALTARYNEILKNGTPHEQERLRSRVIIAGLEFAMLANAYSEDILNEAIASVIEEMDNEDQALVLSALLSLATDNAKELALDKLNAANMLGMYIYGIIIGMDFNSLAKIIASDTGLIINDLMNSNSFQGESRGRTMQKIFDYIELGPKLEGKGVKPENSHILSYLSQKDLFKLAWRSEDSLSEKLNYLESLKLTDDTVLNNLIEKALDYIEQVEVIKHDEVSIVLKDGSVTLLYLNPNKFNRYTTADSEYDFNYAYDDNSVYTNFKKLYDGAEEIRRLGLLLHINLGLYTSYAEALTYFDRIANVISDVKYGNSLNLRRREQIKVFDELIGESLKIKNPSEKWRLDPHKFISDKMYREAMIDIYDGKLNRELFLSSIDYALPWIDRYSRNPIEITGENQLQPYLEEIERKVKPIKIFFNILDVLNVPHYEAYLEAAEMYHQEMLKTSFKYRIIDYLGSKVFDVLGIHTSQDKENLFRRIESLTDRILRDLYFLENGIKFKIPRGFLYFVRKSGGPEDTRVILELKPASTSDVTILLGTPEGNASFKRLMETKIIPDLKRGKISSTKNDNSGILKHSKFISSLEPVLYSQNPQYTTTVNFAPGINMSPRSDSEKAMFEDVKYDFTSLRTSGIEYEIGGLKYDLITLFYWYNLIAFDGRVGENTLANIFLDLQDHLSIKNFRSFETSYDMEKRVADIPTDRLVRELALRGNPFITTMSSFYYEDGTNMAIWNVAMNFGSEEYDDYFEHQTVINKRTPSVLYYTTDENLRNYVVSDVNSQYTILDNPQVTQISLNSGSGQITFEVNEGVVDTSHFIVNGVVYNIPEEYKQYFDKLPTTDIITDGHKQKTLDVNTITSYCEQIINCG